MDLPTFGARNLKHLAKAMNSGKVGLPGYSVYAQLPSPPGEPLTLGLCFRDPGEPQTCHPVYLCISPPEAAETADVGAEEKEIRRNAEAVRVAGLTISQESLNVLPGV